MLATIVFRISRYPSSVALSFSRREALRGWIRAGGFAGLIVGLYFLFFFLMVLQLGGALKW